MGKYTIYDDKSIDQEIDRKLEIVKKCITKHLNNNVISILLAGGYGRGEGSVIIDNGNVKLLKDFDIAVIVKKIPDYSIMELVLEDIYQSLGNEGESLFKYANFAIDLRYLQINRINFPDIWFYDLKSSTLIYGKDIKEQILYNAEDIPLSSGLRLLFEKVTGLLGHFEYKMLYNEIERDAKLRLIYECMKTYIEIATSLCILKKTYISSYSKRVEIIRNLYSEGLLNEIMNNIPDLIDKIEYATKFKFKPSYDLVKDPIELYFNTRDDLITVIQYYIRNYIGININNWVEIEILSKKLAKVYYKPMLEAWLKNAFTSKFFIKSTLDMLNIIYQIYTNLLYIKLVKKYYGKRHLRLINNIIISPSLKFFPAGLLILISLNRDGSINENILSKAIFLLRNVVPIDNKNACWEVAKIEYLKAYKCYLYPTLLK